MSRLNYRGRDDDDLTEPNRVPRCQIPQTDIVDPVYISENYAYEIIAEAWMFKQAACQGAVDLGHKDLAGKILNQMQILTQAQALTPKYLSAKKDQEND